MSINFSGIAAEAATNAAKLADSITKIFDAQKEGVQGHFQKAQDADNTLLSRIGHAVLAVLEAIPLLGLVPLALEGYFTERKVEDLTNVVKAELQKAKTEVGKAKDKLQASFEQMVPTIKNLFVSPQEAPTEEIVDEAPVTEDAPQVEEEAPQPQPVVEEIAEAAPQQAPVVVAEAAPQPQPAPSLATRAAVGTAAAAQSVFNYALAPIGRGIYNVGSLAVEAASQIGG